MGAYPTVSVVPSRFDMNPPRIDEGLKPLSSFVAPGFTSLRRVDSDEANSLPAAAKGVAIYCAAALVRRLR
jgi:hypothetical protein